MFRTRERERETEGTMERRVPTFAEECVLSATCIRAVTEPTPVLSEIGVVKPDHGALGQVEIRS